MTFGENLDAVMSARGIGVRPLAARCGIASSAISRLRKGGRGDPRLSTVIALARGLGVPLAELIPAELLGTDQVEALPETPPEPPPAVEEAPAQPPAQPGKPRRKYSRRRVVVRNAENHPVCRHCRRPVDPAGMVARDPVDGAPMHVGCLEKIIGESAS